MTRRAPPLFPTPREVPSAPDAPPPRAPLHSDWAWRAPAWRDGTALAEGAARTGTTLVEGTRLFLEDDGLSVTIRRGCEIPPAVVIEAGPGIDGFVSLAVDLPPDGIAGLRRRHVVRAETRIDAPGAAEIFLRLNIRHGPNTERLTQPFPTVGPQVAEFDLFHSGLDEARVVAAWIDLIVTRPAPGTIVVGDLVMSRRPRAEV
jgi:hypothetical protein